MICVNSVGYHPQTHSFPDQRFVCTQPSVFPDQQTTQMQLKVSDISSSKTSTFENRDQTHGDSKEDSKQTDAHAVHMVPLSAPSYMNPSIQYPAGMFVSTTAPYFPVAPSHVYPQLFSPHVPMQSLPWISPEQTIVLPSGLIPANFSKGVIPSHLIGQLQRLNISPFGLAKDAPVSLSTHMEIVWHGEFEKLFLQYAPDRWILVPSQQAPLVGVWECFTDSAKVRFSCSECGHGWTSMKGRAGFWFYFSMYERKGAVLFKLYGQQCGKCESKEFMHPMWYPEEVIKVIGNVYNKIGQMYYGFVLPPIRVDRRVGKPRNQHNRELCQACKDGMCREWIAPSTASGESAT